MEKTYELYVLQATTVYQRSDDMLYQRRETTTNPFDLVKQVRELDKDKKRFKVVCYKTDTGKVINEDHSLDSFEGTCVAYEMNKQWKPLKREDKVSTTNEVKSAINPTHYKGFFGGGEVEELQWLEAKQYEGQFKDPVKFKAAVSLQVEKYLDRNGGKDAEAQELSKALWYMRFLVAYVKNGDKPIRVKDIPKLLGEI